MTDKEHLNNYLGRFEFWKAVLLAMESLSIEFASNEPDSDYLENSMSMIKKALCDMEDQGTWNTYTFKADSGLRVRFEISVKLLEPEEVD